MVPNLVAVFVSSKGRRMWSVQMQAIIIIIIGGGARVTISMKPMRSTGMTGQSSRRGICVTPKMYLK